MGFELFMIMPSYCLFVASPLSFGMGNHFLVGFSVLLLMAAQQLVAILVPSQEEMSACPSARPS